MCHVNDDNRSLMLDLCLMIKQEQEIVLDYKSSLIEDRERQVRNEKKLLRLQQRNLEESIMELEYERELISAEKSKLHSQLDKEKLYNISHIDHSKSRNSTNNVPDEHLMIEASHRGSLDSIQTLGLERETQIQDLKQELNEKNAELERLNRKIQQLEHTNDKLKLQLSHFEESMKKENDDKQKHQQSYEKFTMHMETLTKQFEQMIGTKDQEIIVMHQSYICLFYSFIFIPSAINTQKIKESMQEWKDKASEFKKQNDEWQKEKNELNKMIEELKTQNQTLIARNEQLEYTMPQLTIENEHLREQIQEMILTSDEAIKQHQQIEHKSREKCEVNNMNNNFASTSDGSDTSGSEQVTLKLAAKHSRALIHKNANDIIDEQTMNKLKTPKPTNSGDSKRRKLKKSKSKEDEITMSPKHEKTKSKSKSPNLLAINDDEETDNLLSDASLNLEENTETINKLRSQLARSDEKGKLISKHESQHSMTAIIDLVRKTKMSMETQSHDLDMIDSNEDDDEDLDDDLDEDEINRYEASLLTQSADDSFSDHLGLIEDMLNGGGGLSVNSQDPNDDEQKHTDSLVDLLGDDMDSMDDHDYITKLTPNSRTNLSYKNRNKNKFKRNRNIHLMHSDTDTIDTATDNDTKGGDGNNKLNKFLATPDGSNDSNDSMDSGSTTATTMDSQSNDDEPPVFLESI